MEIRKVTKPPLAPLPDANIAVSRRWEGVVTSVEDGYFGVKFRATDRKEPSLIGEFALNDVEIDELELVRPGALLHLYSGQVFVSGTRLRHWTWLQIRRLPHVSSSQLDEAYDYARQLKQSLGITDT